MRCGCSIHPPNRHRLDVNLGFCSTFICDVRPCRALCLGNAREVHAATPPNPHHYLTVPSACPASNRMTSARVLDGYAARELAHRARYTGSRVLAGAASEFIQVYDMLHQRELSGRKTSCLSRCPPQTWCVGMSSVPENRERSQGGMARSGTWRLRATGDRLDVAPPAPVAGVQLASISARKIATGVIDALPDFLRADCLPTRLADLYVREPATCLFLRPGYGMASGQRRQSLYEHVGQFRRVSIRPTPGAFEPAPRSPRGAINSLRAGRDRLNRLSPIPSSL